MRYLIPKNWIMFVVFLWLLGMTLIPLFNKAYSHALLYGIITLYPLYLSYREK